MNKMLIWIVLCLQLTLLAAVADALPTTRQSFDPYGHRSSLESPLGGVRTYDHTHQGVEKSAAFDGQPVVGDAVFGDHGQCVGPAVMKLELFDLGGQSLWSEPGREARDILERPPDL